MRLTKALVKQFEVDQKDHGTHTALFNLLWIKATEDLRAIGVKGNIHASDKEPRESKKRRTK